jgi:predicted metal-dependent enzyme (double-stranded beta helix superfamily)
LGENNGESPGIPYVMEIWPIGHFSPVHNHGSANAVIRVLNGTINVSLFPFLCDEKGGVEPFGITNFVKDDVVWISPTLNQIHQLKNLETSKTSCITIQCYMYDLEDKSHYDYFDYIDEDGNKKQYEPDSDMDFVKFKETMKQEWMSRPKTLGQRLFCML